MLASWLQLPTKRIRRIFRATTVATHIRCLSLDGAEHREIRQRVLGHLQSDGLSGLDDLPHSAASTLNCFLVDPEQQEALTAIHHAFNALPAILKLSLPDQEHHSG